MFGNVGWVWSSTGGSTININDILTGVTSCCPDLQVLIDEFGNVLTGETL